MTEPMELDDVPLELRKLAVGAMSANDALPEDERDQTPDHILAAVLPAIQAAALREAAADAEVKPGSYWPHFAKWLRTRADQIATAASDAAHTEETNHA
jgi:hypothetical protein